MQICNRIGSPKEGYAKARSFAVGSFVFLVFFSALFSEPIRSVPPHLLDAYTLGNRVPIYSWYIDGTRSEDWPILFLKEEIEGLIAKALKRENNYYGPTDQYLYSMFDRYGSYIKGKNVAVIGSETPWYEAIILAYGGYPTTIEYNRIISEDSRCKVMTVDEYEMNPRKFDAIVSISSIEHDGLGRYGDPINPWGDLETMKKILEMLNEDGMLFLSIPVGQDAVYWNAHRVYGMIRLPLIFSGWKWIDSSGFDEMDLSTPGYSGHQPVFVLCPERY